MSRKRFSVERIISHLREAEVLLAQGRTVGDVCRGIGVSEQSFYRWRDRYSGPKMDQARRLKELERENGISHNRDCERNAEGPGRGMQHPASRHALARQMVKMALVCFAPAA